MTGACRVAVAATALAVSLSASGRPVSADAAAAAATSWCRANGGAFGDFGNLVDVRAGTDSVGTVTHYVCRTSGGALLVSADDRVSPVVGASHSRTAFDTPTPFVDAVKRGLSAFVQADRRRTALSAANRGLTREELEWKRRTSRAFLLASEPEGTNFVPTVYHVLSGWRRGAIGDATDRDMSFWDQSPDPFNSQTPYVGAAGSHAVVGCSAVATLHLMHFNGWPTNIAPFAETCGVDRVKRNVTAYRVGKCHWDDLATTGTNTTEELKAEIGYLGLAVGVALKTDYTDGGSYTYYAGQESDGLSRRFGYATARTVVQGLSHRSSWMFPDYMSGTVASGKTIDGFLLPYVRSGFPALIVVSGHDYRSGHCVSVVGVGKDDAGNNRAYVCVGWGGTGDAWFVLPFIRTKATEDGDVYVASEVHEIVTATRPDGMAFPTPLRGTLVLSPGDYHYTNGFVRAHSASGTNATCSISPDRTFCVAVDAAWGDKVTLELRNSEGRIVTGSRQCAVRLGEWTRAAGVVYADKLLTSFQTDIRFAPVGDAPSVGGHGLGIAELGPFDLVLTDDDLDKVGDVSPSTGSSLRSLGPLSKVFVATNSVDGGFLPCVPLKDVPAGAKILRREDFGWLVDVIR